MDRTIYDVFISYSRKDYIDDNKSIIPGNVVSKIKDTLKAENISFWFDEEGIYSGQDFAEKIITNIEASKIFLYLSTENANQSRWTCKEIASADEFGKPIIPVRIDQSPYHRKVLFRIADLDYIEYFANPEKGITDMVESIRAHLDQIEEEERRKKEEEERKRAAELQRRKEEEERQKRELEAERIRQEEEARKKAAEQEALIKNIRTACTQLNSEEAKLEIQRNDLLLSLAKVSDQKQHDLLKKFIDSSSPIRKTLLEQNTEFKEKMLGLSEALKIVTSERDSLSNQLESERQTNMEYQQTNLRGSRWHMIYGGSIAFLIAVFAYVYSSTYGNITSLKNTQALMKDTIYQQTELLEKTKLSVYKETLKSVLPEEKDFIYTGQVDADRNPHGEGEAIYYNGDTFNGTFSHGIRVSGTYKDVNKGVAFVGEFDKQGNPDLLKCKKYKYTSEKIQ